MNSKAKFRLNWIKAFEETGDAGHVCRRYNISRPTLSKWIKRFNIDGISGLEECSKRPKSSPNKKRNKEIELQILELRSTRNIGARRIQTELIRLHGYKLSLSTIHKALKELDVKPIVKLRRKKIFKRYARPIPGDRVQIDTCKIAPGIYQYTAIDDCSRWRVLEIYDRRTAKNTLRFIEKMVEEFPFPIQRIQCDRGLEFFAEKVQKMFMKYGIKFRPVKPRSPHLNGKVERSQKTDLEEFYAIQSLENFVELKNELSCWQFYYNWQRPHGSIGGYPPIKVVSDLLDKTPLQEEISAKYDPSNEKIQYANYYIESQMRKLK